MISYRLVSLIKHTANLGSPCHIMWTFRLGTIKLGLARYSQLEMTRDHQLEMAYCELHPTCDSSDIDQNQKWKK